MSTQIIASKRRGASPRATPTAPVISPADLRPSVSDLALIALLEQQPALEVEAIASRIGLSVNGTARRIAKVREQGWVHFYLRVLRSSPSYRHFLIEVKVDTRDSAALALFERKLLKDIYVERADRVLGAYDYQMWVVLPHVAAIHIWRDQYLRDPVVEDIRARPCSMLISARSEASALLSAGM